RRRLADVRLDLGLVDGGDVLVGHQHHDEVGALHRLGDLLHLQAGAFRLVPGGAALAQRHGHLDVRVVQVLRVRMSLRAVAHDGDLLVLDEREIRVLVVIDFHDCLLKRLAGRRPARGPGNVVTPAARARRARCPTRPCAPSRGSRSLPVARTLISISSRSMCGASDRSITFTTSISLFSCFVICSITSSDPEVTIVIRESDASSVGATVSDSMLYPRAENSPATRDSAPGSFSSMMETMCLIATPLRPDPGAASPRTPLDAALVAPPSQAPFSSLIKSPRILRAGHSLTTAT